MVSDAKTGKIFIRGSQEQKRCTFLGPKHKSAIWDRTPPTYTSNQSICVQGDSGVTNLQTELNYLNLFKSYCNSSDLGFLGSGGWGRWVGDVRGIWGHGGCPPHTHTHAHTCTCTYTQVYMYRNCKWPRTWRHPCLA